LRRALRHKLGLRYFFDDGFSGNDRSAQASAVLPVGRRFNCEAFRVETRSAIVWITLATVSRRTLLAIIIASYDATHRTTIFCFSGSRTFATEITGHS
jgi:hypothetical protein